jgi:nucleotide-binding universal stress UspA family protein
VIVVGVDHSDAAKAALRFALEEAKLRQATLRVVHAWQLGYVGASMEGFYPAIGAELDDLRSGAETALDATLQETIPDTGGVEIERRVVGGAPAAVLVEESQAPICSWSARAGTAASPGCCWGRSVSSALTTRSARW